MTDPVSLVLGITPLVVGAINVYSTIHAKFKTYRKYSREILRLNRQLEIQRRVFLNECHFLLRLVVTDERTIWAMLSNTRHDEWASRSIDQQWRRYLDENYDTCLKIVEEINEKLEELGVKFNHFDSISAQLPEENSQRRLDRIQSAIKMSFKKPGYDQSIKALRTANADLQTLRKHLNEFQNTNQYRNNTSIDRRGKRRRVEYTQYEPIRHASRALHEALTTAWPCSQPTHLSHYAKLLLSVSVDQEVSLHLIILSENSRRNIRPDNPVRLSVRSYNQARIDPGFSGPLPADAAKKVEMPNGESSRHVAEEATHRLGKARKRKLANGISDGSLHKVRPRWCDYMDLRSSSDICSDLARQARPCQKSQREENCIGYIDTDTVLDKYRHLFFSGNSRVNELLQTETHGKPAPVYELLRQPLDNTLTVVDQLKLVRTLVSAMLQFHTTPWLNECWRLQDIGFFRYGDEFSDASLRSLHVTTEFSSKGRGDQIGMDGVEDYNNPAMSTKIEDAMLQQGIRNLPLYSLGVVLLQIGHWARLNGGDIRGVRRLASQACRLGPRYKEIAQRCLDCDFGFGNDLCMPQLQQAIQDSVLDEITGMIDSLDINKD
ncbi:hypothetical protein BGW36DRAFT_290100 [Talaromyces proteolyticus]|uniref:Prion-inhibition and propagation HeLo domain-containing protein n=1 Tax=Talaromyces proteolyticus TaxID=1131652 RepID=A0AAD4PZ49_9EURO|nr:uncharacterized protein BGW36DRAFT_290100 [Talaromyces proteolyticus]KAH8702245.1 hypothetical protein BGW36DRAFT_290100 [Talaromyces proteolyticus]